MPMVQEQLQSFDFSQNYYPNINYQDVALTDEHRKERPYRQLTLPETSSVTLTFGLSGAVNVSKVILHLNHSRTTSDVFVDIAVNGTTVVQNVHAPTGSFGKETFALPADKFKPKANILTIQLAKKSVLSRVLSLRKPTKSEYWLSDAEIYVEREVDQKEDELDNASREMLVCMRKQLEPRRKIIRKLRRDLARKLDRLHGDCNAVRLGGGFAAVAGLGALAIGGILEIVSLGAATPLAVEMEAVGAELLLGGNLVTAGADVIEAIGDCSILDEITKLLDEDKQNCQKIASLKMVITNALDGTRNGDDTMTTSQNRFVGGTLDGAKHDTDTKKTNDIQPYLVGSAALLVLLIAVRLQKLPLKETVEEEELEVLSESEFLDFEEVLEFSEVDLMPQILRGLGIAALAVFTVYDLVKTIANMSRGSPSEMAIKVRQVADQLEHDLEKLQQFVQDAMTWFLKRLKNDLQSSNLRSVAKIIAVLPIFDGISSRYGGLNMTWLNRWNNFESQLQAKQLAALANALNQVYQDFSLLLSHQQQKRDNCDKDDQEPQRIDYVLVAHGSIGAPGDKEWPMDLPGLREASIIPAQMSFATEYISSITFYQPWGVLIDANANYGIINGTIHPSQTRFNGSGHAASVPNTLTAFNVLRSNTNAMIPHVWCNPIKDNDPALRQLLSYIATRGSARPFCWWRQGSMPAFMITAMTSIAAMLLSIGECKRIELHIHHGLCLNWPSTTEAPPAELVALNQYYNAVGKTYKNPYIMTTI